MKHTVAKLSPFGKMTVSSVIFTLNETTYSLNQI